MKVLIPLLPSPVSRQSLCPGEKNREDITCEVAESRDKRYSPERYIYGKEPVAFLAEQIDRLKKGKALCLAVANRFGPKNRTFLVSPNELLIRFASYRVLHYEDSVVELDEGMHQGPGAVVRFIVEKTPATSCASPTASAEPQTPSAANSIGSTTWPTTESISRRLR